MVRGVRPVHEREDTFTLGEAVSRVSVFDGVDVGREVATLDPLLEVLGGLEVRGRVDRRALLLEDRSLIGWVGPTDAMSACSGDARPMPLLALPHSMIGWSPAALAFGEQALELVERLWRLGHADLRGQLLVVEDARQAVVEAHRVERARSRGCPSAATRFWLSCGTGHLSQPKAVA